MTDPLRILLGPVLLVQGKRLYKTIPRLPEPGGARLGEAGAGEALRLLVVGDSSGAGVGAATQDEALLGRTVARLGARFRVSYRLEARNGSTIVRTAAHLRKQDAQAFDVALVGIGINDITGGQGLDAWLASYRSLADLLRERFGVRRIVVSGLPPISEFPAVPNPLRWFLGRTARRYDRALRTWAATQPDVRFIDFETRPGDPLHGVAMREVMAVDGFHPGPRIYDEWGRRAAAAIEAP